MVGMGLWGGAALLMLNLAKIMRLVHFLRESALSHYVLQFYELYRGQSPTSAGSPQLTLTYLSLGSSGFHVAQKLAKGLRRSAFSACKAPFLLSHTFPRSLKMNPR